MNTWIIVLTAVGIALLLISRGFRNYALNDAMERMYIAYGGTSKYAILSGWFKIASILVLFVDGILVLIRLLN